MHQPDQDQDEAELRAERDYLAACRAQLARMRAEVSTALATGAGEGEAVLDKYFNHVLRQFRARVVDELSDVDGAPLFFGRLGFRSGELVHVGRRGVRDDDGEPMVIDWRAPLARAFYEASPQDPMGVQVRRRYGFDQHGTLTAFEDEPIEAGTGDGNGLLATEIERPRAGPMRDIVATVQPEQMRLVRAPLERTVCVQGAPGTGKTAVGLHRLAYLLYRDRDRLRRDGGVAVIGPNRSFLAYIRNVLPALGEVAVTRTTIDELTGAGRTVDGVDEPRVARIKGDARMAEVVRRELWSRVRPAEEPLEVRHHHRTWRLSTAELAQELDAVRGRPGIDYQVGRDLLAQRLAHLVLRQLERAGNTSVTLRQLTRHRAIAGAVRRMWPPVEPARVVFDLLTDRNRLARAAADILTPAEQHTILRVPRPRGPNTMPWTSLDLALLDEAAALIERPPRLGHIVVDEAQDLSPTQLRAIARRMAGSATVLGDLAQATSPAAPRDWPEVLAHLGRPDGHVEELTHGYRVPAQVIDYAARLLPHIAPGLRGPTSFRRPAAALTVTGTTPPTHTTTVVAACTAALTRPGTTALITADEDVPELHHALADSGIPHAVLSDAAPDQETEHLVLAPVSLIKGLEFDTVLVIEPARIVAAEPRGLQRLYVALTRAVSVLHVLHADRLPAPLSSPP